MTHSLPTPDRPLKIGTRGSPLALAQAHETRARLAAAFGLPGEAFEIVVIKVTGDQIQDRALKEIGGKGLFTREIEEALLAGAIDIAVHSMKDMPTLQPEGLLLDCFLPREDVRDAFVSQEFATLADLPPGAVVGSSSLRRRAQLAHRRPDLQLVEFRGNVQTRLKKLAQGAIGVERRTSDARTAAMLAAIHDGPTGLRLAAERAFLLHLDGSCETPIAGLATLDGSSLHLRGEILRPDGTRVLTGERSGPASDAADMGRDLAAELLGRAGPGFFA
jgi:hydroxymethylbilane synthase